ncbi:ATPase, T2SS/T4P/T4SS family [Pandoraea sp.]|uniref:CpaF family protein n=1 Tax=Pandoraea sp. TaxID=1883445 RepID=UPI001219BEC2|nr:ATPase, T2SS/T4P/T4SS family [Pandoraea sp.]TAL56902.1 MAG: CpaF family protein [Pandoraea sp.]TAM17696.1 MAG: CpaF family protein [Pandoraea sp.]
MDRLTAAYALQILAQHLAPIRALLDDPTIQEIMINAFDDIRIERAGEIEHLADIRLDEAGLSTAITIIANMNDKGAPRPILDARLAGLRIAAAKKPIAMRGDMMCIRKHAMRHITLVDYLQRGAFDVVPFDERVSGAERRRMTQLLAGLKHGGQAVLDFLQWMIEAHINAILSGSTSAGKTTLLNALTGVIPAHERLITIEDTGELQVHVPNYVSFETNPGQGITVRDLVRLALRCRPDRIVVGEVRGPEAFDLLDALNTGHSGSAVSFHADSSALALPRLESMIRMAPETQNWPLVDLRRQIANTFRFVIHAQRVGASRGPCEIREILGVDDQGRYLTRLLFSKIQQEASAYEEAA